MIFAVGGQPVELPTHWCSSWSVAVRWYLSSVVPFVPTWRVASARCPNPTVCSLAVVQGHRRRVNTAAFSAWEPSLGPLFWYCQWSPPSAECIQIHDYIFTNKPRHSFTGGLLVFDRRIFSLLFVLLIRLRK